MMLMMIPFQEALRLAAVAGDQGCYARAVRIAGDVYRRKCDIGKALRYEVHNLTQLYRVALWKEQTEKQQMAKPCS